MKRIVIANFYPIWPPQGGGQRRIFFLARELARKFEVEIIAPERGGTYRVLEIAPRLREISIPVERRFRAAEIALNSRVKMAADLAYVLYWDLCAVYQDILAKHMDGAAAAVTTHPYSAYAILSARGSRTLPMVFDSQNVEIQQKRNVLGQGTEDLENIHKIERTALRESALVIACSNEDAQAFGREYGADSSAIRIIKNGVDALGVPQVESKYVSEIRQRLGLKDKLVAVFGGSFHFPNFRAVDRVLEMAAAVPKVVFLILGTVCNYERLHGDLPPNVRCLGTVDENMKWLVFSIADIGLNPMEDGSGTNVKMFEYAAAGLAVVSTPFGARGIDLKSGSECIISEPERFPMLLAKLQAGKRAVIDEIGQAARNAVLETADWTVIGKRYIECFKEVTGV